MRRRLRETHKANCRPLTSVTFSRLWLICMPKVRLCEPFGSILRFGSEGRALLLRPTLTGVKRGDTLGGDLEGRIRRLDAVFRGSVQLILLRAAAVNFCILLGRLNFSRPRMTSRPKMRL